MEISHSTKRLNLKILLSKDADKVLNFYKRNKNHFEPWEPKRNPNFYTLPYQSTSLTLEHNLMLHSRSLRLWIFLKDNPDIIIGCISFYNIYKDPYSCCQVGYKIDRDYTHKGYAYEALKYTMNLISNEYNLHRIEAKIMPSNKGSIKLIKKLGFLYEGLTKSSVKINGKWEDHLLYSYILN